MPEVNYVICAISYYNFLIVCITLEFLNNMHYYIYEWDGTQDLEVVQN